MVRERERNREWRGPANEDGEEWKEQSGGRGGEGKGREDGERERERETELTECHES